MRSTTKRPRTVDAAGGMAEPNWRSDMSQPTVRTAMIRVMIPRSEIRALLEAGELAQDVRETRGLSVPTPLRAAIVRLSRVLDVGGA